MATDPRSSGRSDGHGSPGLFDRVSDPSCYLGLRPGEIIVDSFAGGGGASLGIQWALGRSPDIAINHDREAIALHAANHPESEHLPEDVWQVDPVTACRGRAVGLMWLSPDCKHFSKAKGGKPVSKKIRGLAWTAVRWANAVRPRIIVLENVEEFQGWGPVLKTTNKPDPARKGHTFRRFVRRLERIGYEVEWRELRACDYGAPTIRKRLFLIARCDGVAIVWPEPTHGKGRAHPWRTAAECIDWTIPCPSIFERKKPLAENTLRRIARGVQRFVIDSPKPFIVQFHSPKRAGDDRIADLDAPLNTQPTENKFALVAPVIAGVGGRAGQSPERRLDQPYQTITAKGDAALVVPFITPTTHAGDARSASAAEPIRTITGAHRGEQAIIQAELKPTFAAFRCDGCGYVNRFPVEGWESRSCQSCGAIAAGQVTYEAAAPFLKPRYGENPAGRDGQGQAPRVRSLEEPAPVVVPTGNGGDLVTAFLAKHNAGHEATGQTLSEPVHTVTSVDQKALVTAHLAVHTSGHPGAPATEPVPTVTTGGQHAVISSTLVNLRGTDDNQLTGRSIEEPLPTISGGGIHSAEVRAFLTCYYGNEKDGGELTDPLRTLTTKERFALVTVAGVLYAITDIGMRMLAPRELYNAQGFDPEYRINIEFNGKPLSKGAQVRMAGNSVCPPVACAIVAANFGLRAAREIAA